MARKFTVKTKRGIPNGVFVAFGNHYRGGCEIHIPARRDRNDVDARGIHESSELPGSGYYDGA